MIKDKINKIKYSVATQDSATEFKELNFIISKTVIVRQLNVLNTYIIEIFLKWPCDIKKQVNRLLKYKATIAERSILVGVITSTTWLPNTIGSSLGISK